MTLEVLRDTEEQRAEQVEPVEQQQQQQQQQEEEEEEEEEHQHQEQQQVEQEAQNSEAGVAVRGGGVLSSMLRGLYWPLGLGVRAYRGLWWLLGFPRPQEKVEVSAAVCSPGRHNLAGRKRLRRVTRLLLSVLPRWVQGALGYPVSSSIGRAISPEIRVSPTKPCGKGSKRKQDELEEEDYDDEVEGERQTWVEALTQELADDDVPEEDPDYEPSTIETESDEYHSHNDTESDLELKEKGMVIIEDVSAGDPSTQADTSVPV